MAEPTVFAAHASLMAATADRVAVALQAGIIARGEACAALSGGSTPEPAYALLAARALNWRCVTFAMVDERFVPPTHAASNEAMLRRALAPALAQGAKLAPLYTAAPDASAAARLIERVYAPLRIDMAVMGMGADGHSASWFEGAEGLDAALDPKATRTVVALHAPNAAGSPDRISMTYSGLARAGRVVLLITGEEKRQRLREARARAEAGPVAALFRLPRSLEVLWAA